MPKGKFMKCRELGCKSTLFKVSAGRVNCLNGHFFGELDTEFLIDNTGRSWSKECLKDLLEHLRNLKGGLAGLEFYFQ